MHSLSACEDILGSRRMWPRASSRAAAAPPTEASAARARSRRLSRRSTEDQHQRGSRCKSGRARLAWRMTAQRSIHQLVLRAVGRCTGDLIQGRPVDLVAEPTRPLTSGMPAQSAIPKITQFVGRWAFWPSWAWTPAGRAAYDTVEDTGYTPGGADRANWRQVGHLVDG